MGKKKSRRKIERRSCPYGGASPIRCAGCWYVGYCPAAVRSEEEEVNRMLERNGGSIKGTVLA